MVWVGRGFPLMVSVKNYLIRKPFFDVFFKKNMLFLERGPPTSIESFDGSLMLTLGVARVFFERLREALSGSKLSNVPEAMSPGKRGEISSIMVPLNESPNIFWK